MATDKERATRILEELRSRPNLYLELLHQMTDVDEVLEPWEPLENGTEWVRRGHRMVSVGWTGREPEIIGKVRGSQGHYFADVMQADSRGERRMWGVESGMRQSGSLDYCFNSLEEAFAGADAVLHREGFLLPSAREGAVVGEWKRPERHSWSSLQAFRVGHGCQGLAMVFLRRPAPGEPPYEAVVDGEMLEEAFHSERKAMEACDGELRRRGYVLT